MGVPGRGRPPVPVQTIANLSSRLADVLHGGFVGTIELTADTGTVVRWDIEETLKSGRVNEHRKAPRDPDRFASELESLLADRFTGRIRLYCSDGAIIRYARRSVIDAEGTLLTE